MDIAKRIRDEMKAQMAQQSSQNKDPFLLKKDEANATAAESKTTIADSKATPSTIDGKEEVDTVIRDAFASPEKPKTAAVEKKEAPGCFAGLIQSICGGSQ